LKIILELEDNNLSLKIILELEDNNLSFNIERNNNYYTGRGED